MTIDLSKAKFKLDELSNKINSMSTRERFMILATVLVLLYFVWELVFMGALKADQQAVTAELKVTRKQVQALTDQAELILEAANADPNEQIAAQHKKLQADLANLHQNLGIFSNELITASELAVVLQDLLNDNAGLKLNHLGSLPSEIVSNGQPIKKAERGTKRSAQLYKHGLSLELEGDYFSVLRFVENVEQLKWRIFWDAFEYQVTDYPRAKVSIKLHTLGIGKS